MDIITVFVFMANNGGQRSTDFYYTTGANSILRTHISGVTFEPHCCLSPSCR